MTNEPIIPLGDVNFYLKIIAEQRKTKKKELIKDVATVPVSNAVLEKLVWWGGLDSAEIMSHHQGHDLNKNIHSLQRALEIYHKCHLDLIAMLDEFDVAIKDVSLLRRPKKSELQEYEIICGKEVFSLSFAAATLVKTARHITKKINIPDFSKMLQLTFDANQHEFINELRNNFHHVTFLDAGWSIRDVGAGQTSHFEFTNEILLRDGDFNVESRKFIEGQETHIDVRNLFETYHQSIQDFYSWLMPEIECRLPENVRDYKKCTKAIRANGAKVWWRIIFSQGVKTTTNIYSHVDKHLTQEELYEISQYQEGSKEQVDRIIEMVDEDGACDDELRDMIYKAFKIVD